MTAIYPLPFYLLRAPAFPLDRLQALSGSFYEDPYFQQALAIASPSLLQELQACQGQALPRALVQGLMKYYVRLCTRSTPYGLWAGVSMGKVSENSTFAFAEDFIRAHHRPDISYIKKLVQTLENIPTIRHQLLFFANDTLYAKGNLLRYVDQQQQGFCISETVLTPALSQLLKYKRGATLQMLRVELLNLGYVFGEASSYLDTLINEGLFVSELRPCLTGESPLLSLITRLKRIQGAESEYQFLRALYLQHQTTKPVLPALADNLYSTPLANISTHTQTDLWLATQHSALSRVVLTSLSQSLTKLFVLQNREVTLPLQTFAQRFRKRYGSQSLPLLHALDQDWGIGTFTHSLPTLLQDLQLPPPAKETTLKAYKSLVLKKYLEACHQKSSSAQELWSITLTDEDLATLPESTPAEWPVSFYVHGNLLAASTQALDAGNFQFHLLNARGPSVANLLARFASHDAGLTHELIEALAQEEAQQPEAIFAEIVYLPEGRAGNIVQRPSLRLYEIPCLGASSVEEAYQIPLQDLVVSVDENGSIHLHSNRLKKQVIPRLSSAHNTVQGPPVYTFLAALQYQRGSLRLQWDWSFLATQAYLPRVTYQRIILSRARWNLQPQDPLPWLPQWVCLTDYDQELVLDLHSEWGQSLLAAERKKGKAVILYEWLMPPQDSWVHQKQQAFAHEVVLGFHTHHTPKKPAIAFPAPYQPPCVFVPGSEWLYCKLYMPEVLQEELLISMLAPYIKSLRLRAWFFVRYADPEPHLRIRLQGYSADFFKDALAGLNQLLQPWLQSAKLTMQLDTYQPEVERYGTLPIHISEAIFTKDSKLILSYLRQETQPDDRIVFAVKNIDAWLEDVGFTTQNKLDFLKPLEESFWAEHGNTKQLRQQLNEKYRRLHPLLEQVLVTSKFDHMMRWRSQYHQSLLDHFPYASLLKLLPSYLHMSLNRLFPTRQRTYELITYSFLVRYYTSMLARHKQAQRTD